MITGTGNSAIKVPFHRTAMGGDEAHAVAEGLVGEGDDGHLGTGPGDGVGLGRDHSIFATRPGVVRFSTGRRGRTISVVDAE